MLRKTLYPILLFSLVLLVTNCAENPVTGEKNFMLLSKDEEIAMGKESDPQIMNYFGKYDDPDLQQFISEKGQEMAKISHRPDLPYEFKVVDSPVINAFAVPGGFVYFTRGIMAHFNNEAEFAGVLGHEIGHITARHSARQYSKSMVAEIGLVAGTIISEEFAKYAGLAQTGMQLLFLKYGRDYERQSDKLGVEYSSKVGYDANEMAQFFHTLDQMREESGQSVPTFLSTHPDPENRQEAVREYAEEWDEKLNQTDPKVGRESYLNLIEGIVIGKDPRQGFVENGMFFHPILKFKFPIPDGWNTENNPQQFRMANADGNAMIILTLAKEATIQAAADSLNARYQLTNLTSDIRMINGLEVLEQTSIQETKAEGTTTKLHNHFIAYNDNIYILMAATEPSSFDNYLPTFRETMEGFDTLNDPDILNRKPDRLDIVTVPTTTTLENVLFDLDMPEDRMNELALLNGMTLDEEVQEGDFLKIIEFGNAQ